MRLSSLTPVLPGNIISALEKCGVITVEDLLFSGTKIDVFRRLPPGTISLFEFSKYIDLVIEMTSAPGMCAADMPSNQPPEINCGIPQLDDLLGGFGGSRVLEISGDKGSGKTSLALHVVLRYLASSMRSSALWIDTTGDFSVARVEQILNRHHDDGKVVSSVLERLQISLAFDIEAAYDVLGTVCMTPNSTASSESQICYIVIDTITPLLGPNLSAVSSQGHAIMVGFMRQLRSLAQTNSLTVLVLNNATAAKPNNPQSVFASTTKKPALGPSFPFLTDATLWLSKADSRDSDHNNENDASMSQIHIGEVFRSKTTVK